MTGSNTKRKLFDERISSVCTREEIDADPFLQGLYADLIEAAEAEDREKAANWTDTARSAKTIAPLTQSQKDRQITDRFKASVYTPKGNAEITAALHRGNSNNSSTAAKTDKMDRQTTVQQDAIQRQTAYDLTHGIPRASEEQQKAAASWMMSGGKRVGNMAKSGLLKYDAGLIENISITVDRKGGTNMTWFYQESLEHAEEEIINYTRQLNNPANTPQLTEEIKGYIRYWEGQRNLYQTALRAGKGTAKELYNLSDSITAMAEEAEKKGLEGTSGVIRFGLSTVPAATQVMMEGVMGKVNPNLPVVSHGAFIAGNSARDYRKNAGEDYDPVKATEAAAVAGVANLAGYEISNAVKASGLIFLRKLRSSNVIITGAEFVGKQNDILPYSVLGGVSTAAGAAGETGILEIKKTLEDKNYKPDWYAINASLVGAFVGGTINTIVLNVKPAWQKNKLYASQKCKEFIDRYGLIQYALDHGGYTAQQEAQIANGVIAAAQDMRYAINRPVR